MKEINISDNSGKNDLKEILFMINKNYKNEINIFEFFDNLSLKFTMKLKRKITIRLKTKGQNQPNNNHNETNKIIKNGNDVKNEINNNHTYFEHLIIH